MYCHDCQEEVNPIKVAGATATVISAAVAIAVFLVIAADVEVRNASLVVVACIFYYLLRESPVQCPTCRTRLVGGSKRVPIYRSPEVPLCMKCLAPYPPLQHYCQKCGDTVGQLSPYIPFVNIRFNVSIFGTMWRGLWFEPGVPIHRRAFYVFMILMFMPGLIVILLFLLIGKLRRKKIPKDDAQ